MAVGGLSPNKIVVMGVSMFSTLIRVIWHNFWLCHRSLEECHMTYVVTSCGYKIVAVEGLLPDKIVVMGVSMFSTLIRVIWYNFWLCHRSLE